MSKYFKNPSRIGRIVDRIQPSMHFNKKKYHHEFGVK
jgi:hypothetical protein